MAENDPDEKLVYLACQQIFQGSNSQVRKLKTIKELIEQNKATLTAILREHNVQRTSNVAKKLLESRVFDSTSNAKRRFPELFDASPAQGPERDASEAQASRDEANTVKRITKREATEDMVIASSVDYVEENNASPQAAGLKLESNATDPVLRLVYFRYRDQHVILTTLQSLLEEACFDFARNSFPQILEQHGWDSFEAIELTEWLNILPKYNLQRSQNLTKPFDHVTGLLRELRNSAVHRIPKTTAGIEQIVENAQIFLEFLNDSVRCQQLTLFQKQLRSTVEELQLNKDISEGRYLAQLEQIRTKRVELDKWEKEAMEMNVREDRKFTRHFGKEIANTVERAKPNEIKNRKGKSKMVENEEIAEMPFEVKSKGAKKPNKPERMENVCEEFLDLEEDEEVYFEAATMPPEPSATTTLFD
ncbi:unnamed protein product [Penicillium salamii]|nr:unnamed protein product [Penicillium salamii]CAG8399179.1 unnamed protein product [Penicillium salamii]